MGPNRTRNRREQTQSPPQINNGTEGEEEESGGPIRYVPLRDFYSATSPPQSPPLAHVYSRLRPNMTGGTPPKPSFYDSLVERFGDKYPDPVPPGFVKTKFVEDDEDDEEDEEYKEDEKEEKEDEEEEVGFMEEEQQKFEDKTEKMKRKREELRKKWLRPIKREPTSLDDGSTDIQVQNGNKSAKAKKVGRKRKHGGSEDGPKADQNGVVDPEAKKWVR